MIELCRARGTRILYRRPPSAQPPQSAQNRRALGTPVPRWAIMFRPAARDSILSAQAFSHIQRVVSRRSKISVHQTST